MGIGDEIMVSGQVRAMTVNDRRRVRVLDRNRLARWHPIWDGNLKIVPPNNSGDFQKLINGPGARPYIAEKHPARWVWRAFGPPRGEIVLTAQEKAFGDKYRGRVIVEPHLKHAASPNKDWGWMRWNKLVWHLRRAGYKVTQLGVGGQPLLDGVEFIETKTFREACAVLATARACALPEGGLHHAAAAFGAPAVVIFGGYIAPAVTGYASQVNLFTASVGNELGCGMRLACSHCEAAMAAITPETVFNELEKILVNGST